MVMASCMRILEEKRSEKSSTEMYTKISDLEDNFDVVKKDIKDIKKSIQLLISTITKK